MPRQIFKKTVRWASTSLLHARLQAQRFGSDAVVRFPVLRVFTRNAKRYPITTAGLVVGARYGIGDGIVQLMNGNGQWDPTRTAMFAAFGGTYAVTFGYGVYNILYPAIMPVGRPILNAVVDCSFNSPFLYFPIYYIFRTFAYESDAESRKNPGQLVQQALNTWWTSLPGDLKAIFMFWLPVNSLNFWIVPLHFRQPFMAAIGMGWAMILSNTRGNREKKLVEVAEKSVETTVLVRRQMEENSPDDLLWKSSSPF